MPIYEYKCRACEERFEVEQSFTDDTLTEIDGCSVDQSGHHQVKKVFAAPAIAFKGDGFYRNDARSSSGSSPKTPSESSSEASGSSDSGSSGADSSKSESSSSSSSDSTSSSSSSEAGKKATSSSSSSAD